MRGQAETRPYFLRKQPNGCYRYSNARPESARMPPRSWRINGCAVLRCGPPGAPPGPLRVSKPVGLAFTTGPPPVLAAPGERGRVQGRSCCAGAAGMRVAASRPGPVLVRAGAGRRPPIVRAAAPGDGAGTVACSRRPITRFMGSSTRPARSLRLGRPSTNLAHNMRARHRPTSHAP